MSTKDKDWYYYQKNMKTGPIEADEIIEKIRLGVITPQTHIWYTGLPNWQTASKIEELSPYFNGQSNPTAKPLLPSNAVHSEPSTDLSALTEMRPQDSIDRTGMIDYKLLKNAKKEAKKIEKLEEKHKPILASPHKSRQKSTGKNLLTLTGIVGIAVFLFQFYSSGQLVESFEFWKVRLTSPLPLLEEISTADYQTLVDTIQADILSAGPKLALALSNLSITRPTLFVASNLPPGTNLKFVLRALPQSLHQLNPIEVSSIVQMGEHYAKLETLHTPENRDLPIGEYIAILTEDEDQTPAVAQFLAQLPALSPPPSNKKLFFSKTFFLGGIKDAAYLQTLRKFHEQIHQQVKLEMASLLPRVKNLEDLSSAFQNLLTTPKWPQDKKIQLWKALVSLKTTASNPSQLNIKLLPNLNKYLINLEIDLSKLSTQYGVSPSKTLLQQIESWKLGLRSLTTVLSQVGQQLNSNPNFFPNNL